MAEIYNTGLSLCIGSPATWSRNAPRTAPKLREKSVKPLPMLAPGRPRTHLTPLTGPKRAAEGNTHIYVIKSLHLVKVGLADGLYGRLSNVRVNNPHSPELVKFWELEAARAKRVDVLARDLLSEHHHCGDWYAVAPEIAIAAVEKMIDLVSRPLDSRSV